MSKRSIVLDIETRPNPILENDTAYWDSVADQIQAPGNIKDPAKIAAHRDEALLKARSRMALSARTGMIAMIGVRDMATGKDTILTNHSLTLEAEADLLEEFSALCHELMPEKWIGWNIEGFDLPFLLGRHVLAKRRVHKSTPSPKDRRRVIDLKVWLDGGSLSDWRFHMRGERKEVEGEAILYVPLDVLEEHLRDDLDITASIARAMTEVIQ